MARKHAARFALPCLLLVLGGCAAGSEESANGWQIETDTLPGGIARLVNIPPSEGIQPSFHLVEDLRIGTMDGGGPASFGDVRALAVAGDGRIVALDGQAQEVRVFGPDGSHLLTHGRPGEGPGEFSSANGLMIAPDGHLWVPDTRNQRMNRFDLTEGFVDSRPMALRRFGFTWHGSMLADGRTVRPSSTPGPPSRNMLRVDGPEGTQIDSIFLPDDPEIDDKDPPMSFYFEIEGGNGGGYMGVPFFSNAQQFIHPDGTIWQSEWGQSTHVLARTSLEGDTLLVLETRRAPLMIPSAVRDSAITAIQDRLRDMNGDILDQSWDKVPTSFALIESVFADDQGRLWVETGSESGTVWDVFETSGAYSHSVETDLRLVSWQTPVVKGDYLYGVVTDEFQVAYVVRARIAPIAEG